MGLLLRQRIVFLGYQMDDFVADAIVSQLLLLADILVLAHPSAACTACSAAAPLGGASGQAIDVEIQAKEIMYHRSNVIRILSEVTGRPAAQVEKDIDRDRYMSPMEAVEYGLIDNVIDESTMIPVVPIPPGRIKPKSDLLEAEKDPRKFLTPIIPDEEIY
eukprot:SM000287S10638  [mRNA]  locus=s287:16595:18027:- [translate_table: standard]